MIFFQASLVLSLVFSCVARPFCRAPIPSVSDLQIIAISNQTQTCEFPQNFTGLQCRNATQAAAAINVGFNTFQISTVGEQAALLSWMLFESGDFKFNKNIFPGNPGQGTRNMMIFENVVRYALNSTDASVVNRTLALVPDQGGIVSNATKDAVLNLVVDNDISDFGSAAWYYTNTPDLCSQTIADGLRNESLVGWRTFVTDCLETTVTADRECVYNNTLLVLHGGNATSFSCSS